MPKQPVYVTIGGIEHLVHISVPNGSEERVQNFLKDYMRSMRGVTAWRDGYQSNAATNDHNALQQLIRSRQGLGLGASVPDKISFRMPRRQKRQKYPQR